MVRTKAGASGGSRKALGDSGSRKSLGSSSSSGSPASAKAVSKYAGGNPACPRPIPSWQKGISGFLIKTPGKENKTNENNEAADSPKASSKLDFSKESPEKQDKNDTESDQEESSSPAKKPMMERNGLIDSDEDE